MQPFLFVARARCLAPSSAGVHDGGRVMIGSAIPLPLEAVLDNLLFRIDRDAESFAEDPLFQKLMVRPGSSVAVRASAPPGKCNYSDTARVGVWVHTRA